jgi:hypothetical protein
MAAAIAGLGTLVGTAPLSSQQRVVLPEGTVLTVRTQNSFNSLDARVGDAITTTVTDAVSVEGMTVIPAGTRIEGTVSLARAATSRESGLIGVEFTRLVLPNGRSVAIAGKLTSTDPNERRQIDAQGDARVVFVGGRRGAGAAIGAIGAGSSSDEVSGVLGALGTLLSRGDNVTVPANTVLAVQLESGVALTGTRTGSEDRGTIYTSADMIRRAQQALRGRNYYWGPLDGRLNNDTRRALFEFQLDNEINATGNLDRVTAGELGLGVGGVGVGLSQAEAALVSSNAVSLLTSWRNIIGVSTSGQLNPRRSYQPAELELYFALSAFANNAELYNQMIQMSGNAQGLTAAGTALIAAARRVDAAFGSIATPNRTVAAWRTIQNGLTVLEPRYPY